MSAHVLLNLLNELGKERNCESRRAFYRFRNKFNKFNNTRAQISESIYLYDIKITLKSHFCCKNVILLSLCTQRCNGHHSNSHKSITTSGLSILLHGVFSLSDATSYDNSNC